MRLTKFDLCHVIVVTVAVIVAVVGTCLYVQESHRFLGQSGACCVQSITRVMHCPTRFLACWNVDVVFVPANVTHYNDPSQCADPSRPSSMMNTNLSVTCPHSRHCPPNFRETWVVGRNPSPYCFRNPDGTLQWKKAEHDDMMFLIMMVGGVLVAVFVPVFWYFSDLRHDYQSV